MEDTEEIGPPEWVWKEGRLYCDGTLVELWQLTEEEKRKYIPIDNLQQMVAPTEVHCAMPGCTKTFDTNKKTSWMRHIMYIHQELWEANKDTITAMESYWDFNKWYKERPDAQNRP